MEPVKNKADSRQIERDLKLPDRSFFLFGPRGTGKSTLLQQKLDPKKTTYFNLLKAQTFLELSKDPSLLEAKAQFRETDSWICIDEVQKLPHLLDEVHRLIEEKQWKFALSGSSARKLKRQGANLLAGRAIVRKLAPFNSHELGESFDLDFALQWGNLPLVVLNPQGAIDTLAAYVQTYLREEIREEGLIRKLEPFIRFLGIAGQLSGQVLNIENVAREAHSKRTTVDNWFSILEDTLLGFRLPSWRPNLKVRETAHPKFYWFDNGVARASAGLLDQPLDPQSLGFALETQVLHELRSYLDAHSLHSELFYYQSASEVEVDIIIQLRKKTLSVKSEIICLEIKNSKNWDRRWEKGIKSLLNEKSVEVKKCIGLYRGSETLTFDTITVMPVEQFFTLLHQKKIV